MTGVCYRTGRSVRRPMGETVATHDSPAATRAAGFRACLGWYPDPPLAAARTRIIAQAFGIIEEVDPLPPLAALAAARLTPVNVHRVFRAVTGSTPHAYNGTHRNRRLRDALPEPRL